MFQVKEVYHGIQGVLKLSRVSKPASFAGKTSGLAVKYVKRGREEYTFRDQRILLTVGHFLLLPAGENYSAIHNEEQSVTEGVCIDLPMDLPEDLPLDLLFGHAFSSRPAGMRSLSPCLGGSSGPSADQLTTLKQEILAFGLQGQLLEDRLQPQVKSIKTKRHLVNLLLTTDSLLADRCTGALSLDGIAREVGLSKFHLARLYKQAFGRTLQSRQRALRLEKAAAAVLENGQALSTISYTMGYSSPAAFTRQFRQQYGCSPTEWRQQHGD